MIPLPHVELTIQFEDNYLELLMSHKDVYRAILLHIRDHPDRPFLYHCLGKYSFIVRADRQAEKTAQVLYRL